MTAEDIAKAVGINDIVDNRLSGLLSLLICVLVSCFLYYLVIGNNYNDLKKIAIQESKTTIVDNNGYTTIDTMTRVHVTVFIFIILTIFIVKVIQYSVEKDKIKKIKQKNNFDLNLYVERRMTSLTSASNFTDECNHYYKQYYLIMERKLFSTYLRCYINCKSRVINDITLIIQDGQSIMSYKQNKV
jgi:hypothetical protein